MFGLSTEATNNILVGILVYLGMALAAFWLAMVIWAYRDMRARSRDTLAQVLTALLVAALNLPGLLIYLFLRPRETLSEAYERSLEEEALLQEIEEKPTCPGCRQHVHTEWQACPHCHTRLKKGCVRCGKMLDLTWTLCPYCTTAQPNDYVPTSSDIPETFSRSAPSSPPPSRRQRSALRAANEPVEFVDGE
jgi:Double zinc ribbon